MNITINLTVTVDRADGSHTSITETRTWLAGDNPRFERDEISTCADAVIEKAINRFPEPPTQEDPNTPGFTHTVHRADLAASATRCHSWHNAMRCEDDEGHDGAHHASPGRTW